MENEKQSKIKKIKLKQMEDRFDEGSTEQEDVRGCSHYKRKAKFVVSREREGEIKEV